MRLPRRPRLPLPTAALIAALMTSVSSKPAQVSAPVPPRVLVYTRTLGYRHDSIPTAIEVLGQRAGEYGVEMEFTEDPTQFTDATLTTFDCVMFVSTSEEVLDTTQQGALARFFRSGGVYTGVHSASACLYNDAVYLKAVGAYFDYHPDLQPATFIPLDKTHPATAHLPDKWTFEEEVYIYRSDPRSVGAQVIMTVEESSYAHTGASTGQYPSNGTPHPIAWYIAEPDYGELQVEKPGRSFYTSLGHLNSTWTNDTFIEHVFGGLTWALDGATTRAYGQGLVGNNATAPAGSSASASGGPSASASAGAGAGASAPGSGGSAATSGGSAQASGSAAAPSATAQSGAGAPRVAAGAAAGVAAGLLLVM